MTSLALVGFGKWGAQLLESAQAVDSRAQFSTIVSRSPDRVAKHPQARELKLYEKLDQALSDEAIDGIVLATPHSQHAVQVIECAAARKNVLVAKPFALTKKSCERALDAAATAGIVIAVGHNCRFLPAMARIRSMVAAGELGAIMHIETNYTGNAATRYAAEHWRVSPGESPAGGLAGSGIHMIDAIVSLGGPIADVCAVTSRRVVKLPIDDTTAVLFRLLSGASASLTNIVATVPSFRLQIFGSASAVELRGHNQLVITQLSGEAAIEDFTPINTMRAELEAFVDAIEGRAPYPITPVEILHGVAAFEAICVSVECGEVIPV
jgi:predicted dehydrogenase